MKKISFVAVLFITTTNLVVAQNKNIQVRLNGIFMGECGNPQQCHHEPVAGGIQVFLVNYVPDGRNWAVTHSQESPENFIWKNDNYQLVCKNIATYPEELQGNGTEDRFVAPPVIANNIGRTFYYQISAQDWKVNTYQMRAFLELGSQHKDNAFASVGDHWTGREYVKFDFKKSNYQDGFSSLQTFGPFATDSNRCHQYWVQFQIDIR